MGDKLTHWSYDLPFGARGTISPKEAVMVYMDEESHTELEQPYNAPWNRALHARLLHRLTEQHAAGVVFDIVFSDASEDTNADFQFAEAIKQNGKVILAADSKEISGQEGVQYYGPYDLFFNACGERCSSTAFYPDSDLVTRFHLPSKKKDDRFASEAWEAARLVKASVVNDDRIKTNLFNINYYGPSGTIPWISFAKAISEETPPPDSSRTKWCS